MKNVTENDKAIYLFVSKLPWYLIAPGRRADDKLITTHR